VIGVDTTLTASLRRPISRSTIANLLRRALADYIVDRGLRQHPSFRIL